MFKAFLLAVWMGFTGLFAGVPVPSPSPTPMFPYNPPVIEQNRSYRTLIVGDSMVRALGVNANSLRLKLIDYYPNHEFVNYNYGFGATNIESLPERISVQTKYEGESFNPIVGEEVELIIIESFGYNPLSHLPLEEGLVRHREILDKMVVELISSRPNTVIVFMTPIAPNRANFARGVFDLSVTERGKWVDERVAYIGNHADWAREHNIGLIDVYSKSLNAGGDGDLRYISTHDYVHPSEAGVDLMAKTIADFIFENRIFPE